MNKKVSKIKTKWDSLSSGVQNLAKVISAVVVIGGALTGMGSFMFNQLRATIREETAPLEERINENDKKITLAITRIELISMISDMPDNVSGIEEIAKRYFALGGNSYAHQLYLEWCQKYSPKSCKIWVDDYNWAENK